MYLVGIKNGVYPCGNAGLFKVRYKREYKIKQAADRFAAMYNLEEVYGLRIYSQKLCEMNNTEFVNHVRQNCKRYV